MNLHETFTRADYKASAKSIQERTESQPKIGLILGSGLNPLADEVSNAVRIPYGEIPHFPQTTVVGHVGQLVLGQLSGQDMMIMQGRVHAYEGISLQRLTLPVRVMFEMGVHTLIVTNAAGGLNPAFRAGDLMLITDHLGLMTMTGGSPLWGPNDESLGPRFPAMSGAYDPALRQLAREVAAAEGIKLRQGVYAGGSGPAFETPAEVRFLHQVGADAVGMSTVPEVTVARHMGMRVLGISGISNMAIADPDSVEEADHEEVLQAGQATVPKLMALLRGVLAQLPSP